MSRVLSQLLGADETEITSKLRTLEKIAGHPRADLRLVSEVAIAARQKLQLLGLDPADTTGPELYRSLQTKLLEDEAKLRVQLGVEQSPQDEIITAVQRKLSEQKQKANACVMKQTALKRVLKQLKPKATMKALGYRSMDSMLKHEPPAQLLAATLIAESADWHAKRLQAYGQLQAKDFELRKIQFYAPRTKQWPQLCKEYSRKIKHHVMTMPEAGAVVFLPHSHALAAVATLSYALGLQAVNDIRPVSSYLKLHQVDADFGDVVVRALTTDPTLETGVAGSHLLWNMTHWFYAHSHAASLPEAFDPHVQQDDLCWQDVEASLAKQHEAFGFWEGTHALGHLWGKDTVSFNLFDVAVSACNQLHYGERVLGNMRAQLRRECFGRYLNPDNLSQAINNTFGSPVAAISDDDLELA